MTRDLTTRWKTELGYCRRKHHNSHWRGYCKHKAHKGERQQAKLMIRDEI